MTIIKEIRIKKILKNKVSEKRIKTLIQIKNKKINLDLSHNQKSQKIKYKIITKLEIGINLAQRKKNIKIKI